MRGEENLSDTLCRFKTQDHRAIDDLTWIAKKMPNSKHNELFTYDDITNFIQAILNGNEEGIHNYDKQTDTTIYKGEDKEPLTYNKDFNNRRLALADLLIKESIRTYVKYSEENNKRIAESTMDTLNKAAEIINSTACPVRVRKIQPVKINYLFSGKKEKNN